MKYSMTSCQDVSVVRLYNILWNVVTTSQEDVTRTSHQYVRQVSNETPNNVSVVSHQKVSAVHIYDVLLARLYVVSCNSQLKYPLMLLRYISITYQSYDVATHCQQVSTIFSSYFVMTSIWQVSLPHLSIKSNTNFFQWEGNKRISLNQIDLNKKETQLNLILNLKLNIFYFDT